MTSFEISIIILCLIAGGVLKGATGAGAPILAVPAITAIADLRLAIVVMLVPGILTNIWQAWTFRKQSGALPFLKTFLIASGIGMALGTWALAELSLQLLTGVLCAALIAFVILRVTRPHVHLSMEGGRRLAMPAGLVGGILQGSAGLSGPLVMPYLSSLQLRREAFAGTVSLFFLVLGFVQAPALAIAGIIDWRGLAFSLIATAPVVLGMWFGNKIGNRISPQMFDRAVLALICLFTLKLIYDVIQMI